METHIRHRQLFSLAVGCLWTLLLVGGCSSDQDSKAELVKGQVDVALSALTLPDGARVILTVSGEGISPPLAFDLAKKGGTYGGRMAGIPIGTRLFSVSAYDVTGVEQYRGEASSAVLPNQVSTVFIRAQAISNPALKTAGLPVIDSVVASRLDVELGGMVEVNLSAHDPNGASLTYAWSADCGVFDDSSLSHVRWTAPTEIATQCTLTVAVNNASGSTPFAIPVRLAGVGKVSATVAINDPPRIIALTSDVGRLLANQSAHLTAQTLDADGNDLRFAWEATCTGSFDSNSSAAPVFTLSADSQAGDCAFTVTVDDGEGASSQGRITLALGAAPTVKTPPTPVVYQSADSVGGGEQVSFLVSVAPTGTAAAFAWSSAVGTLAEPSNTATSSHILWTAPASFAGTAEISMTVTVDGLSSVATFQVTGICGSGQVQKAGRCASLVGTYDINYRTNAAGCPPQGDAQDGNPYECMNNLGAPIRFSADFGDYLVEVTGLGPDGAANARIWTGTAAGGTRVDIPPTPGRTVSFSHSAGELSLYAFDWVAGDNSAGTYTTIQLYRLY
jgi:hypothetical protein